MKIVIKIGTQAILAPDGTLLRRALSSLVRQVAALAKDAHDVALVSSGAVGSGRRVARETLGQDFGSTIGEKQVLASLGQPQLMQTYSRLFKPHGLSPAQLLLTKQDFQTRQHYLNIARLLREILAHKKIIPVINENDSVSVEELMFTDNDELSGLIAAQINADKLIILTSVKGVYDGAPDDPSSKVIPVIDAEKDGWPQVSTARTAQGRGGMVSKLGTARRMSELGITTHIAALSEKNALLRIMKGDGIGTTVLPARKKSNIKKWIAFSAGGKNGVVQINAPLLEILKENKRVVSLLPVGITKCSGDFEKGDLVEIAAPGGKKIGVGIARYGAEKLREYIGQKGKPAVIHYDHLHIRTGDLP
ncbi:MAG: glutamate 5-kinase [Alphaproteobacteria bacterium]|nr:glutamate 5-kinase [Alphaproteobacteria bacterium]